MNILLTGGAGYIGSHTATVLVDAGHNPIIFDNFSNSKREVLAQLAKVTGRSLISIEGDVRDMPLLIEVMHKYKVDAVIHFAGLKAVGVSAVKPLEYFSVNVQGAISLMHAMQEAGLYKLVFSSSATVYGDPQYLPIDEIHPTAPTNPYGRTKLHIEEMLLDLSRSSKSWRIACLRYFNPVGSHESGLIGEDPEGAPSNLVPFIARVASGKFDSINVFGGDYKTIDGTGVRDYIHVIDLAVGHLSALNFLVNKTGWHAFNLGTGKGTSVLQMIKVFEDVSGKKINYEIVGRRRGDISTCFAKVDKAKSILNWTAQRDIFSMCRSEWLWQNLKD
jgi:UDP-glucose 4-epimerase